MTGKGSIVVVDDTLASLKLLTDTLAAEGFEVRPADSGALALASVASRPPEVILLDIRMPGMDGFEVCRRLKARPESREIPVLFISATTDQEERVEGLRLGAVDFIPKPFQREDLLARVGIHLELARLRAKLENMVTERTAELRLANERLQHELDQRKWAEDAIRRQAELLDIAHDTILVCDLDGAISFWNHGAEEMYGYTRQEAVGRNAHELLQTVFPQPKAEIDAALLRDGRWEGELINTARDGRRIVAATRQVLQRAKNGGLPRVMKISNDITQRKQAEEKLKAAKVSAERAKEAAEEASRAKDHFLAILSHELRTPLTPIMALTSAWEEDESLSGALREDLETIHRNVELEARLVDDLLDVTRIVHGKISLEKTPVDLCEIIRRVVEVCREDLRVRRIRFEVKTEGEPYPILADGTRLQQVFWNLLKNALKFTPEAGSIGIRCRRAGQNVVAEVTDSGKGIAPEDLTRIFNPFEQIERRESGAFGGLGLGLTLSKALVELHGGTIEAKSEGLGKGSAFCVTLPLAAEAAPSAPSSAPPATPGGQRGLRILLVEDHEDTARILARLLTRYGHEVRTAGDFQEALAMTGQWAFDLLISDLGLPDGNGRDLMRHLRSIRPDIPGIAISGFGTDEDIRQSQAAGFEEHLIKPLNTAALCAVIQRIASKTA
ncbi:MAG: response regulator [Chthoniobacteraceae bacterium]|nr:response regulator [Chthoniobacteraceae bacterium]